MTQIARSDADFLNDILPPGLVDTADRQRCARSALLLRDMVTSRSLVFFVGAGVSWANPTRFPLAGRLLKVGFEQILQRLREDRRGRLDRAAMRRWNAFSKQVAAALPSVAHGVGLEITLGELRKIWPFTFSRFLQRWADLAKTRPFNTAHLALAAWIRGGGTVITTNYDCFIEEAYSHLEGHLPERRYWTSRRPPQNDSTRTFDSWRQDLRRGGVLFKLHGSFHELDTCVATLDQVGTALSGHRTDLVRNVVSSRPVCVVGWRGVDPDISPVLAAARGAAAAEPLVWTLYRGDDPDSPISLSDALSRVSRELLHVASEHPLLSDANSLFISLQYPKGVAFDTGSQRPTPVAVLPEEVFHNIASDMPCSPAARFLGTVFRRAEQLDLAAHLTSMATDLAVDRSQWAAGIQAGAHVLWLKGQRQQAAAEVARVSDQVRRTADLSARLTADFGELSMTVVKLRSQPAAALRIYGLFRQYREDILALERARGHPREIHLHRALYHLWQGRLRVFLTGLLGKSLSRRLSPYVLRELDRARHHMNKAETEHTDAKVDLLSYRALALARSDRCAEARREFAEAERLAATVQDHARIKRLRRQRRELEALCQPELGTR